MGSAAPRNLRSVAITLAETVRTCGVIASTSATSIVSSRLGAGRNVRRRLYDALKVLVAIKIITKSKDGFLKWNGYAHLSPAILRLDKKRGIIQQLAARIRLANRTKNDNVSHVPHVSLVAPFVLLRTHSDTDVSINNNIAENDEQVDENDLNNNISNKANANGNGNGNSVMIILNGYFQILNHSAVIARIARLLLFRSSSPSASIHLSTPVPWTRALGPANRRVEAIAPIPIPIPMPITAEEESPITIPVSMTMSIFDDNDENGLDIIIDDDEEMNGIEAAAKAFDRKEFGGGEGEGGGCLGEPELAKEDIKLDTANDATLQEDTTGIELEIDLDDEPITLFPHVWNPVNGIGSINGQPMTLIRCDIYRANRDNMLVIGC